MVVSACANVKVMEYNVNVQDCVSLILDRLLLGEIPEFAKKNIVGRISWNLKNHQFSVLVHSNHAIRMN